MGPFVIHFGYLSKASPKQAEILKNLDFKGFFVLSCDWNGWSKDSGDAQLAS